MWLGKADDPTGVEGCMSNWLYCFGNNNNKKKPHTKKCPYAYRGLGLNQRYFFLGFPHCNKKVGLLCSVWYKMKYSLLDMCTRSKENELLNLWNWLGRRKQQSNLSRGEDKHKRGRKPREDLNWTIRSPNSSLLTIRLFNILGCHVPHDSCWSYSTQLT